MYNDFGDFMKKNANILEYVEKYKYKYGISNVSDNKRIMNVLTVLGAICWCYAFFMAMIFIIGTSMQIKLGFVDFDFFKNSFYSIITGTVLMVASAVLLCCRQKLIACIVGIISQPVMVIAFSHLMRDPIGDLKLSFYWRHAIPAVLLVLFAVIILFFLLNGIVKDNKLYNMLVEGLYKQYGTRDGEKLTDDEWNEFLSNYKPKTVITKESTDKLVD